MYHVFIRRKVRASFAALGTIAPADEAGNLSENVTRSFAGDSAIGGTRSARSERPAAGSIPKVCVSLTMSFEAGLAALTTKAKGNRPTLR